MNLLLLEANDFIGTDTAIVKNEKLQHLLTVLDSKVGDTLSVGLLNGLCGSALITDINSENAILQTEFHREPPKPLPLTLILALPRPKMLRRIFRNIAELGVKELFIINSFKVEKSYWQTPFLQEEAINNSLKEGLMQAKDTIMPRVSLHKRFKPFVEDELKNIIGDKEAFVAHPYNAVAMPLPSNNQRVIIIGPEGGFIDYEIDLLRQQGITAISMGERIYRVENAITLLSTQLTRL
jgi:RsmE family RNA methyltransferase